jgi:hypothetical protein
MSQYFDNKELFLEPKTKQYGSHMVMTNVTKPSKTKFINMDTRFRDEYNYSQTANYNITLPERINDVKTMSIASIEIPNTIYNISSNKGNNYFKITNTGTSVSTMITLDDGQYTDLSGIHQAINTKLHAVASTFSIYNNSTNHSYLKSTVNNYLVEFDVDSTGSFDKSGIRRKLGWVLGYRKPSYSVPANTNVVAENLLDLFGSRYLYLAIDEFSKGNQNSFISPLPLSLINKNIIARVTIDTTTHTFGTLFYANKAMGYLLSDIRGYTGKIDIQKLNVQLLDEYGIPVDLNGLDFSFCIKVEHE